MADQESIREQRRRAQRASTEARRRRVLRITCSVCRQEFTASEPSLTCGPACRRVHKQRRVRERRATDDTFRERDIRRKRDYRQRVPDQRRRKPPRFCRCGALLHPRNHAALCQGCRARLRRERQCAWCGVVFLRRRGGGRHKYCCEQHNNIAKSKRRKAKLRNAGNRLPSLWTIYERDRGRCGLCRKRVGRTFRWPDQRAASLDHVIPLAKGGRDEAANVQLAHLGCNIKKQTRADTLF